MNSGTKRPAKTEKEKIVRISKKDKENLEGATSWASLLVKEKKEGFRK